MRRAFVAVALVACASEPKDYGPAFDPALAEACARWATCENHAELSITSRCIWNNRLHPAQIDRRRTQHAAELVDVTCINAAKGDCQVVISCFPPEALCPPAGCSSTPAECAVDADCKGPIIAECTDPGGTINVIVGGPVAKSKNTCAAATSKLECDPEFAQDGCEGTRLLFCDGHKKAVGCRELGFTECAVEANVARCR